MGAASNCLMFMLFRLRRKAPSNVKDILSSPKTEQRMSSAFYLGLLSLCPMQPKQKIFSRVPSNQAHLHKGQDLHLVYVSFVVRLPSRVSLCSVRKESCFMVS